MQSLKKWNGVKRRNFLKGLLFSAMMPVAMRLGIPDIVVPGPIFTYDVKLTVGASHVDYRYTFKQGLLNPLHTEK